MSDTFFSPDSLSGKELDEYLSKGYYRMGQSVFTTDLIPMEGFLYPVYWLRVDMNRIEQGCLKKMISKAKGNFTISIDYASITDEVVKLYEQYITGIDFNHYECVQSCLFGESDKDIFDTRMVQIRDENRLIAAGYFDCGQASLMGILNIYHPDYKRLGLGKYLMLLKLEYALQNNYKYYYTGYFSTRYPKFDYKLYPDKKAIDVYLSPLDKWVPYTSISHDQLDKSLIEHLNLKEEDAE